MHKEVAHPVNENSQPDKEWSGQRVLDSEVEQNNTRDGKNQKEEVVSFKPSFGVFDMMITVQTPEKAVHNVFVGKPRDKFHDEESDKDDQEVGHDW